MISKPKWADAFASLHIAKRAICRPTHGTWLPACHGRMMFSISVNIFRKLCALVRSLAQVKLQNCMLIPVDDMRACNRWTTWNKMEFNRQTKRFRLYSQLYVHVLLLHKRKHSHIFMWAYHAEITRWRYGRPKARARERELVHIFLKKLVLPLPCKGSEITLLILELFMKMFHENSILCTVLSEIFPPLLLLMLLYMRQSTNKAATFFFYYQWKREMAALFNMFR